MPGGIRVLFVAELFYELFDAAYATVQQENTKRTALKGQFSLRGPSGETRTRGILLPKQARYQLRYTWIHI